VSGGSIIGSGWLFSAQGALATAGPAALISWVIGVFSLGIHAWARPVALPSGEIGHLIVSVPEEAPEVVLDGAGSGALDLAPEDDGRVVQRQAERRPASGQEA
jgi:hypothetical protein